MRARSCGARSLGSPAHRTLCSSGSWSHSLRDPGLSWVLKAVETERENHTFFTPCLDLVIQYLGHTSRARSSPHASEVYPFVLSEGASLTLVFEELEAVSIRSLRALARRQRATGW